MPQPLTPENDACDATDTEITLSNRQKEVLALVAHGATDSEIAQQLCLSVDTVAWHVKEIRCRLDGDGQEKGTGKKRYVQRTFVDRGYLVLRFAPTTPEHDGVELKPFVVEEVNPDQVKCLVDAFGLPQVPTVDNLPALEGWKTRLARFMDEHERAAGGRRLYDVQALDVARMACKSSVALLYEQGGGVRLVSCWYEGLPQTVTAACL